MPRSDSITVVTGLPRSGTSLMMQVLAAGGVPPATDERRRADPDNPRGYLELDAVKQLPKDAAFLEGCAGRAVKIIAQLLPHLPPHHRYQIIAMRRDPGEVVASQRAMLARLNKPGARLSDHQLAKLLEAQLAQGLASVSRLPHASLLHVDYTALIDDPAAQVASIAAFLSEDSLDTRAMASVVDPALYRQRRSGHA